MRRISAMQWFVSPGPGVSQPLPVKRRAVLLLNVLEQFVVGRAAISFQLLTVREGKFVQAGLFFRGCYPVTTRVVIDNFYVQEALQGSLKVFQTIAPGGAGLADALQARGDAEALQQIR